MANGRVDYSESTRALASRCPPCFCSEAMAVQCSAVERQTQPAAGGMDCTNFVRSDTARWYMVQIHGTVTCVLARKVPLGCVPTSSTSKGADVELLSGMHAHGGTWEPCGRKDQCRPATWTRLVGSARTCATGRGAATGSSHMGISTGGAHIRHAARGIPTGAAPRQPTMLRWSGVGWSMEPHAKPRTQPVSS